MIVSIKPEYKENTWIVAIQISNNKSIKTLQMIIIKDIRYSLFQNTIVLFLLHCKKYRK